MIGAGQLVGTDLTQAVPLTLAAALGALLFGHVEFGVTASLIIGSVPAVLVGSLLSSSFPDRYVRPVIAFVIFASGLKYVGVGVTALGWTLCGLLLAAGVLWVVRTRPWTVAATPAAEVGLGHLRAVERGGARCRPGLRSPSRAVRWPRSGSGRTDGVAEPVLAIHGITSSHASWVAVRRALGERGALVAVDLRGRGESTSFPGHTGCTATRARHAGRARRARARARRRRGPLARRLHRGAAGRRASRPGAAVVLVDGGLRIPGTEGVDPQAFLDAFLGPALARLRMRFSSPRSTASGGARTRRSRAATSRTSTWPRTPITT